jgi:hypothetical protein
MNKDLKYIQQELNEINDRLDNIENKIRTNNDRLYVSEKMLNLTYDLKKGKYIEKEINYGKTR